MITLQELGHPQPPTMIHADNTTAVGIVNNTIKRQWSRAMEMRYFWLLDQYCQNYLDISQQPGQKNPGDYPTKHHTGTVTQHFRPYYIHESISPKLLPRAMMTSALQVCAEILGLRYFWLLNQYCQKYLDISHLPGQENLGDYPTKHHTGTVTQHTLPSTRHHFSQKECR